MLRNVLEAERQAIAHYKERATSAIVLALVALAAPYFLV